MLIVLDGPDGAGKTILARGLETQGFTYHHFDRETQVEDYLRLLNEPDGEMYAVFDRSWASAMIYQLRTTGVDRFAEHYQEIEAAAKRHRGIFVLCLPSLDVCMANWAKKIANDPDSEKFHEAALVADFWHDWYQFQRTTLPLLTFDYVGHTPSASTARLMTFVTAAYPPKHKD